MSTLREKQKENKEKENLQKGKNESTRDKNNLKNNLKKKYLNNTPLPKQPRVQTEFEHMTMVEKEHSEKTRLQQKKKIRVLGDMFSLGRSLCYNPII